MVFLALAYVIHLRDGTYAVRSLDYPGCEGRSSQGWPAREQFRHILSGRVRQMIDLGEIPMLYESLDQVAPIFQSHCRKQIPAPDRLPKTNDYGVIEPVELSPEVVERLRINIAHQVRQWRETQSPSSNEHDESGVPIANDVAR
jgi:hypothetical protein